MNTAIRFENVSKQFVLHPERHRSFQELFVNRFRRQRRGRQFWALREVSFEVERGKTVGIIGTNGSGKSTMLKLISGIIEPTSGRITVNGLLSALLEVGAGFHPDLTGRENIYLNGSILGLSRQQMTRKFDRIVAFSNLGDFIDVPVRNYSSGMYVRLGFSVAVHTDPEVLLVDEVLAVGDAAFQRKCIDRINQLRSQGVTILFVAHDANLVQRMCQRAIWMDKGSIRADGPAEDVLRQYMWYCATTDAGGTGRRWGTGEVIIDQVRLGQTDRQERDVFTTGQPFSVEIRYRTQQRVEQPVFGLAIHDSNGLHITGPNTQLAGHQIPWIEGEGVVHYTVPSLTLLEGTYYMSVAVCNREETCMYDFHDRLYAFRIISAEGERKGVMTLKGSWSWNGQKCQESLSGSKQRN